MKIDDLNAIPEYDQVVFSFYNLTELETHKLDLKYKLAIYCKYPDYTVEEIVGTYLGHNPYFPSFEDWQEQNRGCDDFYSYDERSLGGDRLCWNCSKPLSNHD